MRIIEFQATGAVAAMNLRDPGRSFDCERAISSAPVEIQNDLRRLCELPLLRGGLGISAVFWAAGDQIDGVEEWQEIVRYGAEVFHHEFLPDDRWEREVEPYYGVSAEVVSVALAVAERAVVRVPMVELSNMELRRLVPESSRYEADALDLLMSDGLFGVVSD